jgi:adenosylcobyric acid synthase
MVAGTSARSGKTWISTAICRSLHRRGMKVAPFQALSFSTEAVRCASGGSIALEQARQAEACGVTAVTDMNPLRCLAAPGGGYDVLLGGKPWRKIEGTDLSPILEGMIEQITAAYEKLSAQADLIVIDGMGGALELDQPASSLANLALAERLGSRVLLAANADRGGLFASLVGTMEMLSLEQQKLIKAFVVNDFYGIPESFHLGVKIIEERGGRQCLGVLPHSRTIRLGNGAEAATTISRDELRVVILGLPGRSSSGEFALLGEAEYVTEPTRYDPDVVILPPTSSTLGDLLWMKRTGLDRWVLDRRKEGTAIWGLGGGCHMLGRFVSDPSSSTPERMRVPGLGLLPMQTDILPDRGLEEVTAKLADKDIEFQVSVPRAPIESLAAGPSPFATIGGQPEGFRQRGIVGTIFEGSLKSQAVLAELLDEVLQRRSRPAKTVESAATREEHYEKLADWFEEYAGIGLFDELYLK